MRISPKPVGPLPAAVYWRRRAIIAAPLLAILLTLATCMVRADGSTSTSDTPTKRSKQQGADVPEVQDGTKEHPFYPVPGPAPDAAGEQTVEPAAASTVDTPPPAPAGPGECSDGDLSVQVSPSHRSYPVGSRLKVQLTIKNVGDQECRRDVGAGAQEVTAHGSGALVWSTDHCSTDSSADEKLLRAGEELTFWVVWTGNGSSAGCPSGQPRVSPGEYEVYGRVGSAVSQPAAVTLK